MDVIWPIFRRNSINFLNLLLVTAICFENVKSVDEDASNFTKAFDVWMRFDKGYSSISVGLGEKIPIRCRITVNGTEWTSDDELRRVTVRFYKDGTPLPDYWRNKRLADKDNVTVHTKASFDYLEAEESNRGMYKCQASYKGTKEDIDFVVRIKEEKPQWPAMIIGIQIVLLAIIFFFYERRMRRPDPQIDDDSEGEEDTPTNGHK